MGDQLSEKNPGPSLHIGPLQAPIAFGAHALASAATLLIIGAVAVGLGLAVHWLETSVQGRVSPWIILGLKVGEYVLFFVDLILLIVFTVRSARREIPKL